MAWTAEENKRFEKALSKYDRDTPDRWERIAAMVGGGKTVQDVKSHYKLLVDDVERIESGNVAFPYYNSCGTN
jgi:Myb-like DNA-binding domain